MTRTTFCLVNRGVPDGGYTTDTLLLRRRRTSLVLDFRGGAGFSLTLKMGARLSVGRRGVSVLNHQPGLTHWDCISAMRMRASVECRYSVKPSSASAVSPEARGRLDILLHAGWFLLLSNESFPV